MTITLQKRINIGYYFRNDSDVDFLCDYEDVDVEYTVIDILEWLDIDITEESIKVIEKMLDWNLLEDVETNEDFKDFMQNKFDYGKGKVVKL